jgi:hypothetical protein
VRAVVRSRLARAQDEAGLARFLVTAVPDDVRRATRGRLEDATARCFGTVDSRYAAQAAAGHLRPFPEDYIYGWLAGRRERTPRDLADVLADAAWRSLRADVP